MLDANLSNGREFQTGEDFASGVMAECDNRMMLAL